MKGLGYKQDLPDEGDELFKLSVRLGSLATSPPPSSASVYRDVVRPKNQGGTSSCTGQAVAQATRLAYLHRGLACPELSALYPYFMGRAQYGGERIDDGSYLRTVIKGVVQVGIPEERFWPMVEQDVNVQPAPRAYRNAFARRGVRSYHRVDGGVDGVRRAIASGFPVVGGWMVDERFMNWSGDGVITGQFSPIGGHAMPIVSYAVDGTFQLLNSWGSGWGRDGVAIVDEMFVDAGMDLWAIDLGKEAA